MISLLRVLLSFCFAWEDLSNTGECFSSVIQTPRMSSKITWIHCASYFQLSFRYLDISMKHSLSNFWRGKKLSKTSHIPILAVVAPDQHVWSKTLLNEIYVKRSWISILFDLTRVFSKYLFTKITPVISRDSLHKYISVTS